MKSLSKPLAVLLAIGLAFSSAGPAWSGPVILVGTGSGSLQHNGTTKIDIIDPNNDNVVDISEWGNGPTGGFDSNSVGNYNANNNTEQWAKVFDNSNTSGASNWGGSKTKVCCNFGNPSGVRVDSSTSQYEITGYTLSTGNDSAGRRPTAWTLEGSNDGSTWSLIDDVIASEINGGSGWTAHNQVGEVSSLDVTGNGYSSFRFLFTAVGSGFQLNEIELFGTVFVPSTPGAPLFWDGDTGNWTTPDWLDDVPGTGSSTSTYPQNDGFDVVNPANITEGTVTVNSNEEAFSLMMDTGTAGSGGRPGNGTLNITGNTLAINTGATISNTSAVNISPGATFDVTGTLTIDPSATFNNSGTANAGSLAGTGTATLAAASKLKAGGGSLGAITLTGDAEVETGGAVSVGSLNSAGSILTKSGTGLLDVTGATTLASTPTYNVTAGTLRFSGQLNETSAAGVIKNGAGILQLSNNNGYTGLTTVNDGVVSISNAGALGATGAGTLVNNGASLRLTGGNFNISEPLTLNGGGDALSDGALHSQGNNHDINGPVTLGSNATIRADGGGDMEFRGGGSGGINTAGFELRIEAANTIRIYDNGLSGSGTLRKEENGTLEIRTSNTGYTGAVSIRNGYVDLDNRVDPLGSGQIEVRDDGTLRLRNGVTVPNNITISTDGEGTAGAIRNENNTNTITGTVTSTNNNSRIRANGGQLNLQNTLQLNNNVRIDGNGTLNVTGQVTGGGQINKYDAGRTILANGTNNFTGAVNVNAGTVEAARLNALGNSSGVNVSAGGTLDLSAAGTYTTAVPINISGGGAGGAGALLSSATTKQIDSAITVTGTTIGNSTAGTTFTVNGPINLALTANLTFTGPGDIVVNQGFGNGNTPINAVGLVEMTYDGGPNNAKIGSGFSQTPNATTIDPIINTASYLAQTPNAVGVLDEELTFNSGQLNTRAGGCCGTGDIGVVWTGRFVVDGTTIPVGDVSFGLRSDDGSTLHIDLDQNGTFEPGERFIDNGNTHGNVTVTGTVPFTATGEYDIAIAYFQGGGGSNMEGKFAAGTNVAYGSQAFINPTIQSSFVYTATPDNSLIKSGSGTLTLNAAPTYNGDTTVEEGNLVAAGGNITVNNTRQLRLGSGAAFTATTGTFELGGTTDANKAGTLVLGGAGSLMTVTTAGVPDFSGTTSPSLAGGLLGMWTFDDGTAKDLSGSGHDGTLVGSPTISSADLYHAGAGMSLDTNGGNNGVAIGGPEDDFDVDTISIVAWVKERPEGSWNPYIAKRGESGEGYQLRRRSSSSNFGWTIRGTSGDDDPQGSFPLGDDNGSGGWIHVVARYDGVRRQLIVNGDTVSLDIDIADTGNIGDSNDVLSFGARSDGTSLGNWSHVKLDDIFIYDRALTNAEIATIYNSGAPLPLPQLLGTAVVDNLQGSGTIDVTGTAGLEVTTGLGIGDSIGQIDVIGDLILGDGITIDWEYTNGTADRDLVTITGDLELPQTATVNVTNLLGTGTLEEIEILLDAGSLSGATDLTGWIVTGAPDSEVMILGDDVVLSTAPIPEPSTFVLACLALLGLLACVRRRRTGG